MTVAAAPQYAIRAAARLTGLSVDTLRAWERRYRAVSPVRGDRGRLYSNRHIQRLTQLAMLVERGHAIGAIAGLSDAALLRLAALDSPAPPAPAVDLETMFEAVKRYDLDTIETQLNIVAASLRPDEFIFSAVIPVLHEVGRRWRSRSIRASHEHLVSAIVRSVLGSLLRAMPRRHRAPRLVFATLSGERHELGLLSAAVLAAAKGVRVIFLGADLPASDLVHVLSSSKAGTLVLAATARNVIDKTELDRLNRRPKGVRVWIGGPEAEAVRAALGPHALGVSSLPAFQGLVARLAS